MTVISFDLELITFRSRGKMSCLTTRKYRIWQMNWMVYLHRIDKSRRASRRKRLSLTYSYISISRSQVPQQWQRNCIAKYIIFIYCNFQTKELNEQFMKAVIEKGFSRI